MQNKGIPEAECFGRPLEIKFQAKKYSTQLREKNIIATPLLHPQQRLSGFQELQSQSEFSFPLF